MILGMIGKSCLSMITLLDFEMYLLFHLDRKNPNSVFALVCYKFEINHFNGVVVEKTSLFVIPRC